MTNQIHMSSMNIIGWADLRRKEARKRAWRTVTTVVGIAMVVNVSAMGVLLTPRIATAAGATGTIHIQKQFDTNGDGIVDITGAVADPLLSGWNFTATGSIGAPIPVVVGTTDAIGKASIDIANDPAVSLAESTYPTGFHLASIACTNAAGAAVGTVDLATISISGLPINGDVINCVFVNAVDTASINGQKWNDLNGNGLWDEAAPAQIGNWQIFLDANNNGLLDAGEKTVTTSSVAGPDFGWYHIEDLPYGTYHVCETQQAGWKQTFPATANGCHTVSILDPKVGDTCTAAAPGDAYNLVCDFGNQQQAAIKVIKNVDTNGDGTADVLGATDWTWTLNGGATKFATGSTQYATPGTTVTVKEDQKAGFHFTNVSCVDAAGAITVTPAEQVSFPVVVGGSYTCTYLNTKNTTTTITKQGPATAAAGTNTTYTVNWTVVGTPAASNVVITDPIPANATFVSADNGGMLSAGVVTWNLGTKATGTSGTVSVTLKMASPIANGTVVKNTATIDTDQTDPMSASASTTVSSTPTLLITKTNSAGTYVNPGATVTYTVVVTNAASATDSATGVVLTDVLPTGFTYTVGGGSSKTFALGTIAPGTSVTTTYTATVGPSQASGFFTNTASAKGGNTSTVTATSAVEVRIPAVLGVTAPTTAPKIGGATTKPSLSLSKKVDLTTTNPGKTLVYTMVVKNTSKIKASKVVIKDTLPNGFTFVDGATATKTWTFATLAAGASQTITADVMVGKTVTAGEYTNTATASATSVDPINASANVTVLVPEVKGLATTGVSPRDYSIFGLGVILLGLGLVNLNALRRKNFGGQQQ